MKAVDPLALTWAWPNQLALSAEGQVQVLTTADSVLAIPLPAPPENIRLLGEQPGQAANYPIVAEQSSGQWFTLWGWNGSPSDMTPDGQALFANILPEIFHGEMGITPLAGWTIVSGKLTVNTARDCSYSSTTAKTIVVVKSLALDIPVFLVSGLRLVANGDNAANASIIFAYQDKTRYRYVKLAAGKVVIGQVGEIAGVGAGVKLKIPYAVRLGRNYELKVGYRPDGAITVSLDDEAVGSYQFLSPAIGGTGLAVNKARTQLWDFQIVRETSLSGP